MVAPGDQAGELAALRAEVARLDRLRGDAEGRVRQLEAAQSQLEKYAQDLQRTHRELRRQLARMAELHKIGTLISSVLDPKVVVTRTLNGLERLVGYDWACVYLLEDGIAVRVAASGDVARSTPRRVRLGEGPVGRLLADSEASPTVVGGEGLELLTLMRSSGARVGVVRLVRRTGEPFSEDDRMLVELVATESAGAVQNARLYKETQRLATTDPLTGLFNYRYFRDALRMEVARASRLGYAVGLLMIDADNFKWINDTYGHPRGDEVLRAISDVLQRNLRRTDVVVRYGGEEFAVVLPGLGAAGVRAVGEKLRRAVSGLADAAQDGLAPVPITVSVGGASGVAPTLDSDLLISDADGALYEAKAQGKNRVEVASGEPRRPALPPRRWDAEVQSSAG